jgi:putative PEP-CTERM system histidine kinase
MPAFAILSLNSLLVASGLLGLLLRRNDRLLSLSLLRSILALPLLVVQYLVLAYALNPETARFVLLSEAVFAVTWAGFACRLGFSTRPDEPEPIYLCFLETVFGGGLCVLEWQCGSTYPLLEASAGSLRMGRTAPESLFAVVVLLSMLLMTWRAERFWRGIDLQRRWEYKFLIVSIYMVSCTLIWAGSYRLTYFEISDRHLLVVALLLTMGWAMMFFATARYRLLNRKVFISRKVVHASVAPALFGSYLLGLGMISLLARQMGWPVHVLLLWFLIGLGFASTLTYALSGQLRRRVHHFISTHFYVNKYEYRDEWLSLSHLLRGAITETEIVRAVAQVLLESLYTQRLVIWLGNEENGYRISYSTPEPSRDDLDSRLAKDSPLIEWLKIHGVYYAKMSSENSAFARVRKSGGDLSERLRIVLLSPITAGEQLLGVIGAGEEFTGGTYGHDDFDLLAAVSCQTATALLAARKGEELAKMERKQAIDDLSAFILHDLKNASSMLSLVHANAAEHIHDHEFQQDMLDAVEHALHRLKKVQDHLSVVRGKLEPHLEELDLFTFLRDWVSRVSKKLTGLNLYFSCKEPLRVRIDPELLTVILENFLMNSLRAGGEGTEVSLEVEEGKDGWLTIRVGDNGPGIPDWLLPDKLFEPFRSSAASGSGIGLWQAREMVTRLGGSIQAENTGTGACITLRLPALKKVEDW